MDELRRQIIFAETLGQLQPDAGLAMLSVLAGAPVLRPLPSAEEQVLGTRDVYQTLDSQGNRLVAGNNYMLRDQKVKVLREEFGGGNMMSTFMRVYYLDSSLENRFTVIDARRPGGPFSQPVYASRFEPIKET